MTAPFEHILDPVIEGREIIRTDPHCHILPGLDDGSPDMTMSLRMARRMVQTGIQRAIATPHGAHPGIETDVHPDFLREQVALLRGALASADIPLEILPGTEVFLREPILDLYDRGELITWADQGRYILVELGFQRHCDGLFDVIDGLIERGLTPIIAHPERYLWLPNEPETFAALRDKGCIFQFNMMSINGHFGGRMQQVAFRLMQCAGPFIVGTDSHSDAAKYFDFPAAKKHLADLGLIDENGEIQAGSSVEIPDLNALPSH